MPQGVANLMQILQTPSAPSLPAKLSERAYNTHLTPEEEKVFQLWVKANKIPWQDSPTSDYDMRGFWKAMTSGDPNAQRNAQSLHFPDTWKTPYHKSFSNESMYATADQPHWVGNSLVDKSGKTVFDEEKVR